MRTQEAELTLKKKRGRGLEEELDRQHGFTGYLRRLFRRPRLHRMRLEPTHEIEVGDGFFRSAGTDPRFMLHSSRGQLPTGWVEVSYLAQSTERWITPTLCVDVGYGFIEDQKIVLHRPVSVQAVKEQTKRAEATFSSTPDVRVRFVVCLPNRVRTLRLDPLSLPGPFVLQEVTMREVGVVWVFLTMLWSHLRPLLFRPLLFWRMLGWVLSTMRVEGIGSLRRHFLLRGRSDPADYERWVKVYDTFIDDDRIAIRNHIEQLRVKPLISVVMPVYNTPENILRQTIESVRAQLYTHWELCVADDASTAPHVRTVLENYRAVDARIKVVYRESNGHISAASNSALALATGEWVALLDHDDELAEHALYMVAVELNTHPDAAIVYSDEDNITEQGVRREPYFKPDWNPDLFLSQNMVSHLGVYRTELLRAVGGFRRGYEGAQDWDLVLRLSEQIPANLIRHIPYVLYHWRAIPGSTARAGNGKRYIKDIQLKALQSHFDRIGQKVEIVSSAELYWRAKYPLPQPFPKITLIIPTRNGFEILQRCIESIYEKTTYANYEILIVDNQSNDEQALAYMRSLSRERGVKILRYDAPFNYSAINNFAVRQTQGEVLGFINNDIEVITPEWLEEMVSHALRREIGAVGAMLYYPDDRIQHAGVMLGLGGVAGHVYTRSPRGHAGHGVRARLTQNLSAVTAACLVVRRAVFEEVGGFDEKNLGIAFNDVDLCLRIRERGYRNLWTPYAELYHWESASRGSEDTLEKQVRFGKEILYMQQRWGEALFSDPAYNVNLTLENIDSSLALPPRSKKPWLE